MTRRVLALALLCAAAYAQQTPQPRVLVFFPLTVEAVYVQFATDALKFFAEPWSDLTTRT